MSDTPKYDTGVIIAEYWPLFEEWSANSQYGYPLSWHKTEGAALRAAKEYYSTRQYLLNQ